MLLFSAAPLIAQYFNFGRNKVQYNDFEWKVLTTEHFDIHYYNDFDEIASIGAAYAEEAFREYTIEFGQQVYRRVPLIFYNTGIHFRETNTTPGFIPEGVGGFFEFLKGRVVLPYSGSLSKFKHVIRHELVHVFMTSRLINIGKEKKLASTPFPPLWFVEGLAEYLSTKPDAQAHMIMKDALYHNRFTGISNMNAVYGTFQMYKFGQAFCEYIGEVYGRGAVMRMIDLLWMHDDFHDVIETVTGKPVKQLENEWELYEKRKHLASLESEVPVSLTARQVTGRGFYFDPAFRYTQQGVEVYCIGNPDGYPSVYRMVSDSALTTFSDPKLIIRGNRSAEYEELHFFQSSLAVGNTLLLLVSKKGGRDVMHFHSLASGEKVFELSDDQIVSISSPSISIDEGSVVFSAVDSAGFSDLWLFKSGSNNLIRLTRDIFDDRSPSFSTKDSLVYFSSDRGTGSYNIFSIDLSDQSIEQVTFDSSDSDYPVQSPDGSAILFTSDKHGVQNFFAVPAENRTGQIPVQVSHYYTSVFAPKWLNNSQVVFYRFEDFAFGISVDTLHIPTIPQQEYAKKETGNWEPEKLSGKVKTPEPYEEDYSLDFAQSAVTTDPVYGTRGGAVLSVSDLLSNDKFFLLLYNTAEVQDDFFESFNVDVFRLQQGTRTNYGYGIFNYRGRRYDLTESNDYYFERSYGGYGVVQYPFSQFDRVEGSFSLANTDREIITNVLERKALLASVSASYVFDNSLWGPTGPLDGLRIRAGIAYTADIKYNNIYYATLQLDARKYLRLSSMSALALRASLYYNEGKESRRYIVGGSWDLRGWNRWSLRGTKVWLASAELRFPLLNSLYFGLPFGGIGFFGIRGAVFADAGGVWDDTYSTTLGSVGVGFRMNLFNFLVLRYDIGKKIENNFSRFQKGFFYQFFFGWDF